MKGFTRSRPVSEFARICALAEGQHGLVGISQLRGEVTEQILTQWQDAEIVEPVIDGVIRVRAGARHPHQTVYATWLLAEATPAWERSLTALVISHRSAAELYGAGTAAPEGIELSGRARNSLPAGVTVHPRSVREDECVVVEGLPVTGPARTLADLADRQGLDLSDLGRLARSFISQGWTTIEQLGAELTEQFAGRAGQDQDGSAWLSAALDAAAKG
ncbi:hypothetical protein [Kribbella solani]|uniref:AbiEi antitoxin C-terminal domain-containing protein n=1 Tax=Kribbella solani TaxID=236067 RepID=A0A841DX99_9ACTN|nr:hypothetical protein [Kribbella solani]MBB5982749.1 hypothetical protein [Kribbella solani]